jgi:outer membrane protein TolC
MVARAFWNVRRMLLMEGAYNAGLTRLRESEGMAEARVRAGIAPVVDKNRAGLRSLQQQAAVAQLRGRTQEAMATLAVLLGVSGAVEPVVEASPARQWPDVESLVSRGLSARPELLGARRRVAAQREAVTVERSRLFPHLDLFAVGEYGSSALNGLPPSSSARNQGVFGALAGDFALGLSLSFDLSAVSVLNTHSARAAESIAQETLRQATRQVELEIRAAYIQVTNLHERRELLDAARQLAAENLELLVRRYDTGTALIIELLDGQLDVVRTELDMAEVAALLELADFELEASLGARW